ncbi:hypothetical protein D3C80_1529110 [compost metagenome]
MAGGVGDDELALVGGEEAVGDIDGDALLALGGQAVHQQGEVQFAALGAELLRVDFELTELVLEQHLGFVQQAADQRALAVVDGAGGDEAQQALVGCLVSHVWILCCVRLRSSLPSCGAPSKLRWSGRPCGWRRAR